jgi:hypothetical protein
MGLIQMLDRSGYAALVWRFRSPHHWRREFIMRTSAPGHTGINKLLVSFGFRSSQKRARQNHANFGIGTLVFVSMASASFLIASPAFPQAPTEAQRAAIRSECRSDYVVHCASVPPGGLESLQCLQKNMSSLSSACQSAVRAVEAAAESKAEPTPAATPATEPTAAAAAAPATPAAEPAAAASKAASSTASQPSSAQISAIRSACRADYPKVCAGVPTGGAAALQCLEKNTSRVSAGCQKAVAAASGGAVTPAANSSPTAAAGSAAVPAEAPPPVLVLRPMLPREELFVLRSACGPDVRALCGGVPLGGGRVMRCLATRAESLSPACRSALGQFAAR